MEDQFSADDLQTESSQDAAGFARIEERMEEEAADSYGDDASGSWKDFGLLFKSLREFSKANWLTPVLIIGEVIMELLIPTFMAILIDRGIYGKNMGEVWKWGIFLVLVSLVSLAFGVGAGKTAAVASSGLAKNLRHDLFEKMQGFSFTNIDRFSTGSLVTRLTTDVTNVQNAYQMLIRVAFRAPPHDHHRLDLHFQHQPQHLPDFPDRRPPAGGGPGGHRTGGPPHLRADLPHL